MVSKPQAIHNSSQKIYGIKLSRKVLEPGETQAPCSLLTSAQTIGTALGNQRRCERKAERKKSRSRSKHVNDFKRFSISTFPEGALFSHLTCLTDSPSTIGGLKRAHAHTHLRLHAEADVSAPPLLLDGAVAAEHREARRRRLLHHDAWVRHCCASCVSVIVKRACVSED